jgi:hypothetical protein
MTELLSRSANFNVWTGGEKKIGQVTIAEMNEVVTEIMLQGYTIVSANAYQVTEGSFMAFVCLAKQPNVTPVNVVSKKKEEVAP